MKRMIALLFTAFALFFTMVNPSSAEEQAEEKIYMIPVDRFLNNDKSNDIGVHEDPDNDQPFGGDFVGIEEHLEYIKDMGFNTIMLSPVTERAEDDYLGYDVTSYDKISEAYGGAEAFQDFIDSVHNQDMKIVVDMPTTATEDYTALENLEFNDIETAYYEDIDREIIDLSDADNQSQYKDMVQNFVDTYDVDGISMFLNQDGLNGNDFLPDNIPSYGILTIDGMTAEGFDHVSHNEFRSSIANALGGVDIEIPEFPTDNELVLADHWFSERFTHHAASHNMFPGTRVQQLANYLYAYQGASAMTYGTEVAFNGDSYPEIHPQMDLWTDKEVVEYLENISMIYDRHQVMAAGETETLLNEAGQYIVRYKTNDVDFVFNMNNTSETQSNTFEQTASEDGKVYSGMLIGDMIRPHEGEFITVLDREETELYSIIEEAGFNNGYLYASILIFGLFAIFVWVAASRSKKRKNSKF
ncbi:alpha-amylase family glycosyl hydrolase [Jeotgalicoccus marinus]|uniref:alpha-amylase family glycosyl hydrolase n=1 Tax=Jeotgalicoccus marinus TaxID=516700 RepID=UPI0004273520|nr:alpha-amylase family glycosyl hydrolase [Jeotgalicoccus marinus]